MTPLEPLRQNGNLSKLVRGIKWGFKNDEGPSDDDDDDFDDDDDDDDEDDDGDGDGDDVDHDDDSNQTHCFFSTPNTAANHPFIQPNRFVLRGSNLQSHDVE